ncbi:TP53-regulated inhibitor of apoptosis 1-like isoform X2 [Melanaphis sacchari]|uniref:TP53-regulated inhibitor of apoptosis 1 n=1 Tax=Melanaphis sacchari TaxID=742174 RepID=A0A2H8TXM6_9HEMI|nr:TP53-regulated inhibitor of apoptosis 1-like isoform X2 [Melanaphis sacchari]
MEMDDKNSNPDPTKVERLNSFHPDCNELKQRYDECFNVWFTEHYMNGHYNNEGCNKVFELYTDCVKRGMKEYGLQYEETTASHLGTNKEKTAFTDSKKPKSNDE